MDIKNYKLIAHRGLYNNKEGIVENTIKAFNKAIEKGYAIELDVQILKDGNLIVFHDDNLLRLTGINKRVYDSTLEYIKSVNLLNTNEKIPTLKEVLDTVLGKVPLVIEIKSGIFSHGIEKKLYDVLKEYNGKFCIESFNLFNVLWFKNNAQSIPRGLLTTKDYSTLRRLLISITNNLSFADKLLKLDFLACNYKNINPKLIKRIKNSNIHLFAWTINNEEEYERLKNLCDGIIFENFIP